MVERVYRGCKLTIEVKNPDHVQHGVKRLIIHGNIVDATEGAYITAECLSGRDEEKIVAILG